MQKKIDKRKSISKKIDLLARAIETDTEMKHSCKKWNEDCSRCQVDKALAVLTVTYE